MKNHIKTARAHFAFAAMYSLPLIALLAGPLMGLDIAWPLVAYTALFLSMHMAIGCGARRGRNWARVVTLVLAVPMLLAIPLGTLIAILLISYCWSAWDDGHKPACPAA